MNLGKKSHIIHHQSKNKTHGNGRENRPKFLLLSQLITSYKTIPMWNKLIFSKQFEN